ncbi:MAG: ATP-binding protein [Myxococcales bacterium]|nr:ATP-binding protein [Myxococcales bacterium]
MSRWLFYGRGRELLELEEILQRQRWFFARITGRRRIGKTTLIQQALEGSKRRVFYVQIPDSAPAGVLSAIRDAMETFSLLEEFAAPDSLRRLADTIGKMAEAGIVVVLDEFQYFARAQLGEFTSYLQAVVDDLSRRAEQVPGGLFVLGSLHTELVALLEDRSAPLYNRTTDQIELVHLDIASVLEILAAHTDGFDPGRLLFLWNIFEGVPKFYRDCYEQDVLGADRQQLLRSMFFRSSSPLKSEAENWFLSELRGRYDVVLKFVARNPGCSNGDITAHVKEVSPERSEQTGGYLKILIEKYRMVERRLPIFAKDGARSGRYYVQDNFLRAWLGALSTPVSAINFRPETKLLEQADQRLMDIEGYGLEKLVAQLYEERSRKAVGDFPLTERLYGYWERQGTELDLIALDGDNRRVRLGTCKRNPDKLIADLPAFDGHIERFLQSKAGRFKGWTVERVAIAPALDDMQRAAIVARGYAPQDLDDLTTGLR